MFRSFLVEGCKGLIFQLHGQDLNLGEGASEKETSNNPSPKMYTTVALRSAKTTVPYYLQNTKIPFFDVGRYFQHPLL